MISKGRQQLCVVCFDCDSLIKGRARAVCVCGGVESGRSSGTNTPQQLPELNWFLAIQTRIFPFSFLFFFSCPILSFASQPPRGRGQGGVSTPTACCTSKREGSSSGGEAQKSGHKNCVNPTDNGSSTIRNRTELKRGTCYKEQYAKTKQQRGAPDRKKEKKWNEQKVNNRINKVKQVDGHWRADIVRKSCVSRWCRVFFCARVFVSAQQFYSIYRNTIPTSQQVKATLANI